MSLFYQLPEFERELKKLSKKYPTLISDIEDVKQVILTVPTGIGKNFTIIAIDGDVTIVKVRVHCESLRSRSMRLIYSYHQGTFNFLYIEIYFKGDKENENRERIAEYLQSVSSDMR